MRIARALIFLLILAICVDEATASKRFFFLRGRFRYQPPVVLRDEDLESSPAWEAKPRAARSVFKGSNPAAGMPKVEPRPQPQSYTFNGCKPQGSGGDTEINFLKNRVDTWPTWHPVAFDTILNLPWPEGIRKYRSSWTAEHRAAVAQYEGLPISVEGFIAHATRSGAEACNCGKTTKDMIDYHVCLVKNPKDEPGDGIVVEVTPRIRALHSNWGFSTMETLKEHKPRVRISGWLLLDPFHPSHIDEGRRGTLWEIHPIMDIEVQQNGQWIKLDDWSPQAWLHPKGQSRRAA